MRITHWLNVGKTAFRGSLLLIVSACNSQGDFPDIADVPPRPQVTETPADLEKEIEEIDAERVALERRLAIIRREQNTEAVFYRE